MSEIGGFKNKKLSTVMALCLSFDLISGIVTRVDYSLMGCKGDLKIVTFRGKELVEIINP